MRKEENGMRRFAIVLAMIMMTALSVSACGGENAAGNPQGSAAGEPMETSASVPEETNPENGLPLSKQPDATAPVLASIIVYAPEKDGSIKGQMEAAEELNGENVVALLVEKGTLEEGARFVSLEEKDSDETAAAGPGADSAASIKNGTVTLSGFAPGAGLGEDTAKQAVIDTFRENFELGAVELRLQ